jgi:site-specific DNA-methyltransferase (adenine-specific)
MIQIYNANCIDPNKRIADESVDLGIFDPPFGIGEAAFDKHYNREDGLVIGGYQEAPKDYDVFTLKWMTEAVRVLKPNGSMYIIIGHSSLRHVLNAAYELGLAEVNHIIWKYNFGVATKKKFVTSHYHILYLANPEGGRTFNTNCRFGSQERDKYGGSLLYDDLEDVFVINK